MVSCVLSAVEGTVCGGLLHGVNEVIGGAGLLMNTSAWGCGLSVFVRGPGCYLSMIPHTQDASPSFLLSSISQQTPHPQGVKLIFPRPQGITKRQCGKHGLFEEHQISTLLLSRGSILTVSWWSCVLASYCATGTKRDVPSKINQNQHMLQSSSIKYFPAEPLRQGKETQYTAWNNKPFPMIFSITVVKWNQNIGNGHYNTALYYCPFKEENMCHLWFASLSNCC